MPGRPECTHCPFRDDPETPCTVLASGHVRFCRAVDPEDDIHDPRMVGAVRRLSLEPLGRWVDPAPAFPSLVQQARNLAGAVVEAVASGIEVAPPEEQARRLAICAGCPDFIDGRCRHCGCVMGWKVRLAAWRCPIGKF